VVLHDRVIPGAPGNIDHLVIGPTGIFVVDSKVWAGRVVAVADGVLSVGGYPVDLRPSLWEAEHVLAVLGGELAGDTVVPVICVHGAFFPADGYTLVGLDVVPGRELCRHLQRPRARRLRPADIARLAAAAEARLPAAA
jgi:Nuclease-related domain.